LSHCHTLIDALRQRGHRITPQREMIIEALAHAEGHASAEDVFAEVQNRTRYLNIATVYRTLDLLVASGLASRVDLWDGCVVYTTHQHGPHAHLVCRRCGEIFNADHSLLESLGNQLQSQYQFAADLEHVSIIGVCAECRSTSGSL